MSTTEKRSLREELHLFMEEARRREQVIRERMAWVETHRRRLWQRREELDAVLAGPPPPSRGPEGTTPAGVAEAVAP